ncbi:hypothetical protein E2C01_082944 [Portunus trituberculatus]|uniref:Uncharacterized protein n=1 Tax=Portunus trituberculatus TaxID=210409 RepID=A0A5B7IVV9_PORTR|nr:hypothetical protein [Portunus trituberculatus]
MRTCILSPTISAARPIFVNKCLTLCCMSTYQNSVHLSAERLGTRQMLAQHVTAARQARWRAMWRDTGDSSCGFPEHAVGSCESGSAAAAPPCCLWASTAHKGRPTGGGAPVIFRDNAILA